LAWPEGGGREKSKNLPRKKRKIFCKPGVKKEEEKGKSQERETGNTKTTGRGNVTVFNTWKGRKEEIPQTICNSSTGRKGRAFAGKRSPFP